MNKLGFGFLRLPEKEGPEVDYDLVCKMVDRYMSFGHNYFDTAYTYLDGRSEKGLRECLVKRYPRDSFRIADKLPGYMCKSYDDCRKFFNEQLERCGVDYFDVYMLHWLNGRHYEIAEKCDEFKFLEEIKKEGLAKKIGFSYHDSAELLDKILTAHPTVDYVQIQMNYLDWESEGVQSRRCYDVCVKHNKKIVVMEPVKGGTLSKLPQEAESILRSIHPDWSMPAWALRFVASHDQVEIVLSGMNSMDQMEDNLAENDALTEDEYAALEKAVSIINSKTAVPCTGCRYCVSHCPMEILIPDYFKMYNEICRYPDEGWKIKPSYEQLSKGHGMASECIECGSCQEHCPQHIHIPEIMKEIGRAHV